MGDEKKIRCAHLFLISEGDPAHHHATFETSCVKIDIYAVANLEKGEELCRKLVNEGTSLIELCGSWGYEGASRILRATDNRVPVGFVTHQQHNSILLARVMETSTNPYNKL
jgi:hypothetical protein